MTDEQKIRLELPNCAVTNATEFFLRLLLTKDRDLYYICDRYLARQILNLVKEQVKIVENVHAGKYYADDFCTTIDTLFKVEFKELI